MLYCWNMKKIKKLLCQKFTYKQKLDIDVLVSSMKFNILDELMYNLIVAIYHDRKG